MQSTVMPSAPTSTGVYNTKKLTTTRARKYQDDNWCASNGRSKPCDRTSGGVTIDRRCIGWRSGPKNDLKFQKTKVFIMDHFKLQGAQTL